jgi:hypothetical protein
MFDGIVDINVLFYHAFIAFRRKIYTFMPVLLVEKTGENHRPAAS